MTPLIRVLLSVIYWILALGVILVAGYVFPGDCWTERTRSGFDQCINEGRTIHIAGVAIALLTYLVIWRVVRRR
jgi:hypothetical protein